MEREREREKKGVREREDWSCQDASSHTQTLKQIPHPLFYTHARKRTHTHAGSDQV